MQIYWHQPNTFASYHGAQLLTNSLCTMEILQYVTCPGQDFATKVNS